MIITGKPSTNPIYTRVKVYSLDTVFSLVRDGRNEVDGFKFKPESQRYKVFKNSCVCVSCGMRGSYFALEKCIADTGNTYHFNLYAINFQGWEVLMTKDHIFPRSKGGPDTLDNYQSMCTHCNRQKDSSTNIFQAIMSFRRVRFSKKASRAKIKKEYKEKMNGSKHKKSYICRITRKLERVHG